MGQVFFSSNHLWRHFRPNTCPQARILTPACSGSFTVRGCSLLKERMSRGCFPPERRASRNAFSASHRWAWGDAAASIADECVVDVCVVDVYVVYVGMADVCMVGSAA